MKKCIITTLALLGLAASAFSQNINWRAFKPEQRQIAYLQGGWDYGLGFGLGYGRKFNTRLPVLANAEYSFPAGERLFDDFKVRLGGQVQVLRSRSFSATVKVYCPFRRFENSQARLLNFGCELSGVLGLYRPRWFVAGEFGFDKAVATHVKHSPLARENYPGAQDGWYVPTGGNFFYGLQAGFSFRRNDLSAKAGCLTSQGWHTAPFVPLYAQVAYTRRF